MESEDSAGGREEVEPLLQRGEGRTATQVMGPAVVLLKSVSIRNIFFMFLTCSYQSLTKGC